jgi:glycerol-3-phosphate dehydrogenase
MQELKTDIVIVGAGIAGLWMLNTLTKQGYDVLLLEAATVGGQQSVRSQGIIHGGMKYALNGVLSQASDAIKEMPDRWKRCIAGDGDVDLQGVIQYSNAHYLWSQKSLGAKITSFFAKKAMSGRVDSVDKNNYPTIFNHTSFKGNLYKLNEIVLDVPSVLRKLSERYCSRIIEIDTNSCQWQQDNNGNIHSVTSPVKKLTISAQRFIFSAGEGNEAILAQINADIVQMQRRPLHMSTVTHRTNLPIYAHCIGASSKPLVTITHHINDDGTFTWYLGGDHAETGVERDSQQQIDTAQQLLKKILPWVTLEDAKWDTLRVNRAEPMQNNLTRPDSAFVQSHCNYIVAWPTKLALAPDLSDKVIDILSKQQLLPMHSVSKEQLQQLPKASIATTPWMDS